MKSLPYLLFGLLFGSFLCVYQAPALAKSPVKTAEAKPPFEEVFKKLDAEVRLALKKDRAEGVKELERVGRMLSKDYPEEFMPYAMLSAVARMTSDQDKSLKILNQLAALDSKDPKIARIVGQAKARLKKMEALGKPLDLSFVSIDGRRVDMASFRGKVVLLDFWATWCGPCVKEIPNIKRVYKKYHKEGFEVIGISLDTNLSNLRSFISKNNMPWPQYFDGLGWKTILAVDYGISSIPAMWLIDQSGKLCDLNARTNFEEKVVSLLRKKHDFLPESGISEPEDKLRPVGSGTGFLISNNGYIVTNHHVVKEGKKFITRIPSGSKYIEHAAKVIVSDMANDISIIKVEGTNFEALPIVQNSEVRLAQEVFTVGFPIPMLLGKAPKYSQGNITSLSGIEDDFSQFQISVPLQPGNSGGPLLTDAGNVIGITTSSLNTKFVSRLTGGAPPQLVNYAVKSSYVLALIRSGGSKLKKPLYLGKANEQKLERVELVEKCKKSCVQIIVFK